MASEPVKMAELELEALHGLLDLIRDDGHALLFQTFGQYRTNLINEVRRKIRGVEGVMRNAISCEVSAAEVMPQAGVDFISRRFARDE